MDLNARLSGKIEEKSENVKSAASGCISVILKTREAMLENLSVLTEMVRLDE